MPGRAVAAVGGARGVLSRAQASRLCDEFNMLRRRRSPFVVHYLGAQLLLPGASAAGAPAGAGALRVFMEHLPGGTLEDLLRASGALPTAACAS